MTSVLTSTNLWICLFMPLLMVKIYLEVKKSLVLWGNSVWFVAFHKWRCSHSLCSLIFECLERNLTHLGV